MASALDCFLAEAFSSLLAPFFFLPSPSRGVSAAARASSPRATASSTLRLRVEFQWFLMALSVRPTNVLAISAHLLPNWLWARISLRSSSRLHSSRLISGLRWLYQRSRHCLPMRPGSCCAILDHCLAPSWPTSSMILASSSVVHGPLTSSGLRTFCQRCRHWTSVRSSKYSAVGWKCREVRAGDDGQFEISKFSKGRAEREGAFESAVGRRVREGA